MKSDSEADELLAEYDLASLANPVIGKHYDGATNGPTNVVLIDPDLTAVFPDSESANRALRLLADTARAVTSSTAATSTGDQTTS